MWLSPSGTTSVLGGKLIAKTTCDSSIYVKTVLLLGYILFVCIYLDKIELPYLLEKLGSTGSEIGWIRDFSDGCMTNGDR